MSTWRGRASWHFEHVIEYATLPVTFLVLIWYIVSAFFWMAHEWWADQRRRWNWRGQMDSEIREMERDL
jgi:hypothetical protein